MTLINFIHFHALLYEAVKKRWVKKLKIYLFYFRAHKIMWTFHRQHVAREIMKFLVCQRNFASIELGMLKQGYKNSAGARHARDTGQPLKASQWEWPCHHHECDGKFEPSTTYEH